MLAPQTTRGGISQEDRDAETATARLIRERESGSGKTYETKLGTMDNRHVDPAAQRLVDSGVFKTTEEASSALRDLERGKRSRESKRADIGSPGEIGGGSFSKPTYAGGKKDMSGKYHPQITRTTYSHPEHPDMRIEEVTREFQSNYREDAPERSLWADAKKDPEGVKSFVTKYKADSIARDGKFKLPMEMSPDHWVRSMGLATDEDIAKTRGFKNTNGITDPNNPGRVIGL